MYINRITFSISKAIFKEEDWLKFNGIAAYHEELLHHYLPRKTNLGGFGFFSNKLETQSDQKKIKPYGQCIDYNHTVGKNEVKEFLKLATDQQLDKLNIYLQKAVSDIADEHEVDTTSFMEAIAQLPNSYSGFEKKLKVSKNHKSRKINVVVVRSVKPESENILYRIMNKSDELLEESLIQSDSSIYDCSYSYRKSKWKENELQIFDRFDRIHKVISVETFL